MGRYVAVSELKDWARSEIPTADDAWITAALTAAELTLDTACGRKFVVATTSTARVFTPAECSSVLRIHDCTSVTTVVEDGTTLSSTGWQLEPLNGLSWSGEARPYDQIRLLDGDWWYTDFQRATISVTAAWGWAAIPAPVVEACKILAKDVLSQRDVRFGLVAVTDAAGIAARMNPLVRQTIEDYRRVESFGVA
jgi:hypothetical protein